MSLKDVYLKVPAEDGSVCALWRRGLIERIANMEIELKTETSFTVQLGEKEIKGLQLESKWEGFAKYSNGYDWLIVAETSASVAVDLLKFIEPGATFSTPRKMILFACAKHLHPFLPKDAKQEAV